MDEEEYRTAAIMEALRQEVAQLADDNRELRQRIRDVIRILGVEVLKSR